MKIQLIIVDNGQNVGDKNQSLGIKTALENKCMSADIEISVIEYSSKEKSLVEWQSELANLIDAAKASEKTPILISAGQNGLVIIDEIKRLKAIFAIWSGHQVFDAIHHLAVLPDIMAFPKHQIAYLPEGLSAKTQIVLTDGVPHNISETTINLDCDKFAMMHSKLPALSNTAVIILPGDAPDLDGTEKLFTEEEARSLAERVYAQFKEKDFVVTNGPRTGKHIDPARSHRDGKIDPVTTAFCEKLKQLTGKAPELYDFQFNKLPSAYKPLLKAIKEHPVNILLCPGESTSMVTESAGYLPRHQLAIYEVAVMNAGHYAHLEEVKKQGRIQVLKADGSMITSPGTSTGADVLAAEQIANEFIRLFLPIPTDVAGVFHLNFIKEPSSSSRSFAP